MKRQRKRQSEKHRKRNRDRGRQRQRHRIKYRQRETIGVERKNAAQNKRQGREGITEKERRKS